MDTISSMRASPGGATTRTWRSPSCSAVPAYTVEPRRLCTSLDSPVMLDSSMAPWPRTTVPSTGSTLPAPRCSTWPRLTSSMRTWTSLPSTTAHTVSGLVTRPSFSARCVLPCTCLSMEALRFSRNMTVDASEKAPRSSAVVMAVASSISTVSWPCISLRRPSQTNRTAWNAVTTALTG